MCPNYVMFKIFKASLKIIENNSQKLITSYKSIKNFKKETKHCILWINILLVKKHDQFSKVTYEQYSL